MRLDETLHAAGIELCFAEVKEAIQDKLKRFGLFTRLGEDTFVATLEEAVGVYLQFTQSIGKPCRAGTMTRMALERIQVHCGQPCADA